jgi:epoxyqueuosine reductase
VRAVSPTPGPPPDDELDDWAALREAAVSAGLHELGVTSAAPFVETRRVLEQRRDQGLHGDMAFTYRNPARSTDPTATLPSARSLVAGAVFYGDEPEALRPAAARGRVARYARADAYERLRTGLGAVARHLRDRGNRAVVVADQNNLVDRAVAHRAGLGWFGKSANLLVPGRGSWFVLGAVVTDALLPVATEPVPDGCGSCRRCLDACPTGAIVEPGVVDARRCLAWLVQSPGAIPEQHRVALGDRLYGCDDCQDVCPPSRLRARPESGPPSESSSTTVGQWVDLLGLLASSDEELLDRYGAWYIPRREARYLRRTALVVLGNTATPDDPVARAMLERYAHGDDALLAEHAAWSLDRLEARCSVPSPAGAAGTRP